MSEHDDQADETEGYELVLPFVVCESQGGPYNDEAFVAGWEAGRLDLMIAEQAKAGARGPIVATVHRGNLPIVDLIAMRHGYTLTEGVLATDDADTWQTYAVVEFSRHDLPPA